MLTDDQVALLKEGLQHTIDLVRGDISALKREQDHDRELNNRRLSDLERSRDDHEQRLRSNTEGVTQFKFFVGLAGASIIMAIIALIKTFIGP